MSQLREEAFKNLKLDGSGFFMQMLRRDSQAVESGEDFDIYLMETSLMPLLLQGFDALSRQVYNLGDDGKRPFGEAVRPFNPLTWLAQYLLRNHPRYLKDHRTPMYQRFAELASVERGRRCLLRRRGQVEAVWMEMEKEGPMAAADVPRVISRLDDEWNLEGAFVRKMPASYHDALKPREGEAKLTFNVFWAWFEGFVNANDLVREATFNEALRKQSEEETLRQQKQEESERLEMAIAESKEQRSILEDRFQTIVADMYIDSEISRIMNKGAFIHGLEEREDGPPLKGDHIALILSMLKLWDVPKDPSLPKDEWDDAALTAWRGWLESRGLHKADEQGMPEVNSAHLQALISHDAFQEHLSQMYPIPGQELQDMASRSVEVRSLDYDDPTQTFAEAIDSVGNELLRLIVPESMVDEIASRLASDDPRAHPVLVLADLVANTVIGVLKYGTGNQDFSCDDDVQRAAAVAAAAIM